MFYYQKSQQERLQAATNTAQSMSLSSHLSELRSRLIISSLAVLVFFIIALCFSSELLLFLKQPLVAALPGQKEVLHFTGPLDVFMTGLKVSFLVALLAACPVWLFQFWRFIEPALYAREKKSVFPFLFLSISLFVLGLIFSYKIILPLTLSFLLELGMEVGTPIITITDYISMLSLLLIGFGLVFEVPLILILLAYLEILSAEVLRKARRYVVLAILILAAIMTPPDPLSQIGMAIPLYIMYELSIAIIYLLEKKRKARD